MIIGTTNPGCLNFKIFYIVCPEHSLYPWHVIDCFLTLQESKYAEENKKIQKELTGPFQDDSVSKLELESRYAEENKKIQKELVGLFLLMIIIWGHCLYCFFLSMFASLAFYDHKSSNLGVKEKNIILQLCLLFWALVFYH